MLKSYNPCSALNLIVKAKNVFLDELMMFSSLHFTKFIFVALILKSVQRMILRFELDIHANQDS